MSCPQLCWGQSLMATMGAAMTSFDIWKLGRMYSESPHHHFTAAEKSVICAFVECQWQADIVANCTTVRFVDYQPYCSARAMREAVLATGELLISTLGNVQEG